jgi:transmembrane sensor
VELVPGERAELSRSGGIAKRRVKAQMYTSWKEGKLIFEAAPLGEIAQILEERYAVRVEIAPELASLVFTGGAPVERPEILLQALEEAFDIDIKQQSGLWSIRPRR